MERLYEIARDKEKAAKQLHDMALVTTALGANGLVPTMSNITDAEGFKIINRCSSSPSGSSPKPNIPPAIKGQVQQGGNPFTNDFLLNGGKWDLADYTLDPYSRQPTKKAFHGKETTLVMAALSATTSASPAHVSIYTKKQAALASPAKFGFGNNKDKDNHLKASQIPSSVERKQEFDRTMDENERLWDEDDATRKARSAPLDHLVDEVERESAATEAAQLNRIKLLEEHFYGIAQAKVVQESDHNKPDGLQARGENDEEDSDDSDPGGIYSGEHDKDDDSFSFHKSKASSDDEDERELGEEARGVSPLSMGRFKPNDASEVKKFEWLNKIDIGGTYDKEELLAAPTDQIFPCIACNNHCNIHMSTWAPAFLHKSSGTTWDIFDVNFDQTLHKLDWSGDEGLKNLWGLYFKYPDAQFIQSYQAICVNSTPQECHGGKMKDRSPDAALAECPEHHLHHPILDDATTAATTFSLSITSVCLTPGTSSSSTTDALIKYNAEFQDTLTKHQGDILCLLNNCATSGTPAIPTKMINKVRMANLETMKKINQEASRNGGKKLSSKKLKKLGAQVEKAAKVQYVANCDTNNAMEQERLPLKKDMLV